MSAAELLPDAVRRKIVRWVCAQAGPRAAELDGMGRYLYIVRHTAGLCARACAPVAQLDRAGTF